MKDLTVPVVCLLAFAPVATAQVRAQISGFVHDGSGSVVQEAAIAVVNLDTGVRRSTRSNSEGFYAVSSLTPGSYKITVRKPGFQTVARTGFQVHALEGNRLDFLLEPGSVHDEITVEATVPISNLTDASESWQTGRLPAELLPVNGRGLQALIDLAPGVLATPATMGEAGQFSANGQRPATNYFTVDGVSANNGVSGSGLPGQFSGAALPAMTAFGSLHNLVALGELDEMRIGTSTYAPEFGRLPGAQIAVTTRSGSNEVHGELFGMFRHERAAANDPFANAAGLGPSGGRLLDAGATLGGPLRRNQTFFHLSTEYLKLRQPVTFLTSVPSTEARATASSVTRQIVEAFPLPNGATIAPGSAAAFHIAQPINPSDVHTTAVRVDQALSDAGNLFLRYNRAPSSTETGYFTRNRAQFRSQAFTAGVVAVTGPGLTLDGRLGFSRTGVHSEWLRGAVDLDLPALLPPPGHGQRLYGIGIRGVGQVLSGDPGESRQNQWNLAATGSFTAGRHELRFGVDYLRLSPSREQAIASVTALYNDLDRLAFGAIPTYTFAQTGGGSSLIETTSLFVQDTWHVTPRLNLTWGVRQEITPAPSYRGPVAPGGQTTVSPNPVFALPEVVRGPEFSPAPNWRTRANQFAPRAGLAYRIGDSWVLRAGAGLFYDLGFSSAVDLVNGAPYNRFRSLLGPTLVSFDEAVYYGFAQDLRLPRTAHWNVTLERMLSRDSAVSVGYVAARGTGLLRREGYTDVRSGNPRLLLATNNGESSFHSMQVHYRSRNVRGLMGTVSYTWSHAIDNGSWDSASWLVFQEGGSRGDRGSANFDVRHSLQAALAYDLGRTGMRFARGWTVSGILRLRAGFPIDVITTDHPFGLGFDNERRPDLVAGVPLWLTDAHAPGGRRLNPAAFANPIGRQGTLGRNAIRGNSLSQVDLALQREFARWERWRVTFRAEAYNISNTPQFADAVRVLSSPIFGYSPSTMNLMLGSGRPNSGLAPAFQSGGARVLQAGFTVRF